METLQNDRGLDKTIPKAFEKPKAIGSSFLVYADSAKDLMVYLVNLLDSLQFPDISSAFLRISCPRFTAQSLHRSIPKRYPDAMILAPGLRVTHGPRPHVSTSLTYLQWCYEVCAQSPCTLSSLHTPVTTSPTELLWCYEA